MKKMLLAFAALLMTGVHLLYADLAISNIEVLSGYPWKDVLIGYTITGSTDQQIDHLEVTAKDNEHGTTYECKTLEGVDFTPSTHILKWKAQDDGVKVQSTNVVFTMKIMSLGGVQLWENGPYWAECNVGASHPEEYGYYFWWGDTVGYKRNSGNSDWVSVKDGAPFSFSSGYCPTCGKDNSTLRSLGYIDASGNLVAAYDAATAHLGAPWRMPTDAEFSALINNCDTTWTTQGGVCGHRVKGRGAYASKSIFLPAAGYGHGSYPYSIGSIGFYWSSTPYSGNSNYALDLHFQGDFYLSRYYRYHGQSVRPLRVFAE